MTAHTDAMARKAIEAFSDFVYAMLREQDEKLYRPDWVADHGELVNKKTACQLLGRSLNYLNKQIDNKQLQVTSDGKQVFVRSLQLFAERPEHKRHKVRQRRKKEMEKCTQEC